MSDNFTVTVQITNGSGATKSFDPSDAAPPPLGEGDIGSSFDVDDPAPPPEADDNNAEMSAEPNQVGSASASPPGYDNGAEADVSDDEIDEPPPIET